MRRISCVFFNQDGSRLAVGFDADADDAGPSGFCVFSCEPVSLESCSSPSTTSTSASTVTTAALLYKTSVSAFVLASQPNVVALHDGGAGAGGGGASRTKASKPSFSLLGELSFPASTKVLAIRLRRDAMAVALSDGRAAAYSLDSLRLLRSVETGPNEHGLLSLAAGGTRTVFACPASGAEGAVRVEFVDAERSVVVRAARHGVAALALSQAAELLATASERGTLVRVFSLGEAEAGSGASAASEAALTPCLRELRRGGGPARMLSLAFSPSVQDSSSSCSSSSSSSAAAAKAPRWLAAASDKGTVHVWRFSRRERSPAPATTTTAKGRLLLAAVAAAAGAPSPSSVAAERSTFHFKLPGFLSDGKKKQQHEGGAAGGAPVLAALSFSPGGKAVYAASSSSGKGEGGDGGGRCGLGLVAVALPDENKEGEAPSSSAAAAAAAAELFCVPDLFALLPRQ